MVVTLPDIANLPPGTQDGPVWGEFGSLEGYLGSIGRNSSVSGRGNTTHSNRLRRQSSDYWLTQLGPLGKVGAAK